MKSWEHYNNNDRYWYWFVNLRKTGRVTMKKLLDHFMHPAYIFEADEKSLAPFLNKEQMLYFLQSRNMNAVSKSMCRLSHEHTRFIHWESSDYPARLKKLPDPPYGLYLRGSLPSPGLPSIAMIGSRKATHYGRSIAEAFARQLAGCGVQIISGLAEGIDAASHRGALEGQGYTLGILGGGIDSIYPRENFNLYMDMYQTGGVLSEWNLGVPAHPGMFPVRNRLISGLSDAVFVLEAARKSGTFITVDQALEQGRTVFALPGRITDANSIGTNLLIADGAVPVTRPEDIIEYLEMEGYSFQQNKTVNDDFTKNILTNKETESHFLLKDKDYENIYRILDEKEARDFAYLLNHSGCDILKLSHILYELEFSGMIFQPNQNIYLKKI